MLLSNVQRVRCKDASAALELLRRVCFPAHAVPLHRCCKLVTVGFYR